ncbi:ABC transporter permease [Nocardioides jishulii]|uniref:FtsX-like permease family protein n=1 Tax=Nocardioides jishulii TaxID=2575440 RepID=A0A4U2YV06_9ACTN|nr:FtsX-like permease family protein [Nocardioides jishulii]QCX28535.1 FtsX-like permease family protein [Nocardioides jishulii]TKI64572.1 FtsX-like permease family protein [Nocardioides jishulii]
MFLALRELRFARARFGLMGAVIVLIAILMVLLSGLAQGLTKDGVSGLQNLPVSSFAFEKDIQKDSAFTRSVVEVDDAEAWAEQPGVKDAAPFGLALVNGANQKGTQIDLALIGVEQDSFVAPEAAQGDGLVDAHSVVLSADAEEQGIEIGDVITLEQSDIELTVSGFLDGQNTFGHVDMGYVELPTWQAAAAGVSLDADLPQGRDNQVSAIAVQYDDEPTADQLAAGDEKVGTSSLTLKESYGASPGYTAETSTLMLIQVFLYAICALVAGAFFTVLTIHRKDEIAVMRAMGASTGYLLRDGLGQALILLLVSVGLGVLIGVGAGAGLQTTAMPFALQVGPIALASVLLIVLGLVGAAIAIVRITRVDPLTALGASR